MNLRTELGATEKKLQPEFKSGHITKHKGKTTTKQNKNQTKKIHPQTDKYVCRAGVRGGH